MSWQSMSRAERARYLIGRVVLDHLAAFDKAADENRDPEDMGAMDVQRWLDAAKFTDAEAQLLLEETGIVVHPEMQADIARLAAEMDHMRGLPPGEKHEGELSDDIPF